MGQSPLTVLLEVLSFPTNANGEPDVIGNVEAIANYMDDLSEALDVDTLESKKETYMWIKVHG